MVVEGLQLLHPIVQMDGCSQVLVQGDVHRRRPKLDDCVVFLVGRLNERKDKVEFEMKKTGEKNNLTTRRKGG